jgi:hypothetical protein
MRMGAYWLVAGCLIAGLEAESFFIGLGIFIACIGTNYVAVNWGDRK